MDFRTFWLGWRHDLIRFAALCSGALVLGLLIHHMVGRGRSARRDLAGLLPGGVNDLATALGDDDTDSATGHRSAAATWTYRGRIASGESLWVRDRSGSVSIEPSHNDSLVVKAVKTFGHSDSGSVQVVAVPGRGGIAICALWGGEETHTRCGSGTAYHQGSASHNDVRVRLTVRVPRGVAIDAATVIGGVRIVGASGPVVARAVNGDVDAETTTGPLRASTVNGNIRAAMRSVGDTGEVKLVTVNGEVTVELPPKVNASVDATTVNGAIESEFPLAVTGKFVAHHATGTIGAGGRRIEVKAVNGTIHLRKVAPTSTR
jgi:hypothetical protein